MYLCLEQSKFRIIWRCPCHVVDKLNTNNVIFFVYHIDFTFELSVTRQNIYEAENDL